VSESRNRDAAVEQWLRRSPSSTEAGPATDACLDPEEMAALIDGRLTREARASAEAHLAGCARCQAIAGTIARTESIVQWATPVRRSPWRWLTWALPLTAAATIVMMVVMERQRESAPQPARADASQAAGAPRAEPPPSAAPKSQDLKDEARAATPAQARQKTDSASLEKRAANEAKAGKAIDAIQPGRPAAPPPAGLAQARAAEEQQKPAATATSRVDESDRLLARRVEGKILEIRAPDPARRWRITGARVERSTDAGATWTSVPTGVSVEILAGAAPSASVCWLAGRGGLVLVTTDGTTWQRVSAPTTADLSAIRATDSRTATVTTADGQEFTTTDAGRTWLRRDLFQSGGLRPAGPPLAVARGGPPAPLRSGVPRLMIIATCNLQENRLASF
jgi:putative zinc finger protein